MHNQQLLANDIKPKEAYSIRKEDINLYKSSEGLMPKNTNDLESLMSTHIKDSKN